MFTNELNTKIQNLNFNNYKRVFVLFAAIAVAYSYSLTRTTGTGTLYIVYPVRVRMRHAMISR
jgi:hypothetical protein